jgi:alpha-1,2-mannosyltransferase
MTASRLTETLLVMKTCRSRSRSRTARCPRFAADLVGLLRGRGGWATLALSVAIYAAVSTALHQPFHVGGMRLRYFDLRIYHLGALRLMHGSSLYRTPMVDHLGFTYPPFAALLLAPLAWVPLSVDKLGVTGLNILLLVWALRRTLMFASLRHASDQQFPVVSSRTRAWSRAAGVAAAALWLEPITVTLGYGQINLLIMALVVFDLSRPDQAPTKGVAIGVAAAIKLTPLLFIAYLLLSRRGRAAGVAALSFVASIALVFEADTRDASAYWFHEVGEISRIGNPMAPVNQSLHGVIARFTGTAQPAGGWELLVVAVVVCGLALAVRAGRRGDEANGFSVAALTTLLASPISWSHHWTLAVPALILLARRSYEQRSRALGAAVVVLGLVGYAYLPEIAESHFRSARGAASLLTTDPYPLFAVLVLAVCAVSLARASLRRPKLPAGVRGTVSPSATISSQNLDHALGLAFPRRRRHPDHGLR